MIAPLEELPLVDGIVLDPAPASIHSHVKMMSFFFFLCVKMNIIVMHFGTME
jgi:hypothetical protein